MYKLISVIIPVYNVEAYVRRCLDSVLANSYTMLEIICIDDGSTDSSGKICDEYAKKDARIKVIHQNNAGLSGARNTGLAKATGDYIAFIDSDDWIHNDYFQILMNNLELYNAQISIGRYKRVSNGDTLDNLIPFYSTKILSRSEAICANGSVRSFVWGKIYTKEIIADTRFDASQQLEDIAFNAELNKKPSCSVVYTDIRLYAYYKRPGSLSTKFNSNTHLSLAQMYLDYFNQESDSAVKAAWARECLKQCVLSARHFDDKKQYTQVKTFYHRALPCTKYAGHKKYLYMIGLSMPKTLMLLFKIHPLYKRCKKLLHLRHAVIP